MIKNFSKKKLGYDIQKPEALLERIIKASSNEGDIVLDPFCGCGTTAAVSERLNRQFTGIDISSFAVDLIRDKRLKDKNISIHGIPFDLCSAEKLGPENPYNFESWVVTRLPGFAPNTMQGADGGVHGRASIAHMPDNWKSKLALSQVNGSKFSLSALRDFIQVTDREKAAMGCYITLRPVATTASRIEVVSTGKVSIQNVSYPRMQTWSIAEYFDEKLPKLPIMSDPYLDEPCVNPRYSGMTTREMVRKVVLRRDDPMDDSASESEKIERE